MSNPKEKRKLFAKYIDLLKKEPAVTPDEIEKVKMLLKDFEIEKKYYTIVDIYPNYTCVYPHMISYKELLYYIWYNTKYKDKRYIVVDGNLLNYELTEEDKSLLNNVIEYLTENKNIQFKRQ